MFHAKRGQGIVEYVALIGVILLAILSTNLIGRVRGAFEAYRNAASDSIAD